MKAKNQSSAPVTRPLMHCPVSGSVSMQEYEQAKKQLNKQTEAAQLGLQN